MLTVVINGGGSGADAVSMDINRDYDRGLQDNPNYLQTLDGMPVEFVYDMDLPYYLPEWIKAAGKDDRLIVSMDYGLVETHHGETSPAEVLFFDPDLAEYFADPRIGKIAHSNDFRSIPRKVISEWSARGYDGGFSDIFEWTGIIDFWITKDDQDSALDSSWRSGYWYPREMHEGDEGDTDITRLISKLTGHDLFKRFGEVCVEIENAQTNAVKEYIKNLPPELSIDDLIKCLFETRWNTKESKTAMATLADAVLPRINLDQLAKFLAEQVVPEENASPLGRFKMSAGDPVNGYIYTWAECLAQLSGSPKILLIKAGEIIPEKDFGDMRGEHSVRGVIYLGDQLPGHYLMACKANRITFMGVPDGDVNFADLKLDDQITLATNGTGGDKTPVIYKGDLSTVPGIQLKDQGMLRSIELSEHGSIMYWLTDTLNKMLVYSPGNPGLYFNMPGWANDCGGVGLVRTERLALQSDIHPIMAQALLGDQDALSELQKFYTKAFGNILPKTIDGQVDGVNGPIVIRLMDAREWGGNAIAPENLDRVRKMQLEAVRDAYEQALDQLPHILVPLVGTPEELELYRAAAREIFGDRPFKLGAMIETVEGMDNMAAIASVSDLCSFGTNDFTADLLGLERGNMVQIQEWMTKNNAENPFTVMTDAVLQELQTAIGTARAVNPNITLGICGAQGADLGTFKKLMGTGLDYISIDADTNNLILCGTARVQHLVKQSKVFNANLALKADM